MAIVKNSQYEKRCKECFTITVSEKPLENGEPCPTCKRALEDVDHSDEINANKKLLVITNNDITRLNTDLVEINKVLGKSTIRDSKIDQLLDSI